MTKQEKIDTFDPNGVGLNNGNFIGLPFDENDADIVLLSVPWDVTVSFADGTSTGPQNILECSTQLDLANLNAPDLWKKGIYFRPPNAYWLQRNGELRGLAKDYISFLENDGKVKDNSKMQSILEEINYSCENLRRWVYEETKTLLKKGKLVGLVGGEHSVPLGYLQALAEQHGDFGVLQIDAHLDLREAYEGFTYSHASIFYNTLTINEIQQLTQVGIRDFCEAELDLAKANEDRISIHFDQHIREDLFKGKSYDAICERIIETLPQKVYISFDIDGLKPELCPNTGTPVPGGLDFNEAMYLIKKVTESGREIIGFDLSEVGGIGNDWDGNVGARVLYQLCGFLS